MTLFNRLSKANQDLIFENTIDRPRTRETVLEALQISFWSQLTIAQASDIHNCLDLRFDITNLSNLFIEV